jgi:hypothetical protein
MPTLEATSWKALNRLTGQFRLQLDALDTTMNTSVTTVELTNNIWNIAAGDWIEINTEPMMVVQKNDNTLTVLRAPMGNTATSHTAGDIVSIKPWFFRADMNGYLLDEVIGLPSSVFAESTVDVNFVTTSPYAELDVTAGDPLTMLRAIRDPSSNGYDPLHEVQLKIVKHNAVTSGYAVQTSPVPLSWSKDTEVRVTFSHVFDTSTWTDATDLIATVGLTEQLCRVIEYGAAARAMDSVASARTQLDTQGSAREAEEVPAGLAQQMATNLRRTRTQLLAAEVSRLRQKYGIKIE